MQYLWKEFQGWIIFKSSQRRISCKERCKPCANGSVKVFPGVNLFLWMWTILLYLVRNLTGEDFTKPFDYITNISICRVSWKADGMRYMMLIDGEDEVYFFDRDHNIFKVDGVRFVHRKDIRRHLRDTLLDGVRLIFYFKLIQFII